MQNKMKAIVADGPNQYGVKEIAMPTPGPGEVLCKVHSCAICRSDIGLFSGRFRETKGWPKQYPFIFGHEWAGEVVECGKDVNKFRTGDRVAGEAHSGCGNCANCKKGEYTLCLDDSENGHKHYGFTSNGAYAEYAVYREDALTLMPDGVSFDEATMCDTAGVALHANRVAEVGMDDIVVVYGPGPIGNTVMQIAKIKGAYTIMVGRGERLTLAKESGADLIFDYEKCCPEEEIMRFTNGQGASVIMDCAGSEASFQNAFSVAGKNAKIVMVAMPKTATMPVPVDRINNEQISLLGTKANPNCSEEVLEYISSGKLNVEKLITHRFRMEQMEEALDLFGNKKDGAMKVVIQIAQS